MQNGGILSGVEIIDAVGRGEISISPWNKKNINSASYDLTLGSIVAVYRDVVYHDFEFSSSGVPGERLSPKDSFVPHRNCCIDISKQNAIIKYEMDQKGIMLKPGIGYLMHTSERISTSKYEPVLDGKSSIGRLFVTAHVTAGYGDPGFDGQYTLEVVVVHPTIVYPGVRFCQMRFHTIVGDIIPYEGSYCGKLAEGPVPSRSWKMFNET